MGDSGEGTLPQDHEDQMQLGIRIVTTAFQKKMNSLEQEIRSVRMTSEETRDRVAQLHKRNSALEVELVESHQRSQQLAEENRELFKTVGMLRKQIGKLDMLKQAVTSHIQDHQATEHEDGNLALMSDEYLRNQTPHTAALMGMNSSTGPNVPQRQTRPLSPPTHAVSNTGGWADAGGSNNTDLSGGIGSGSPLVDGKAFFRLARSQLSYEAFNQFLANIKQLNNGARTREETLEEARRIFGTEHQDLYKDFETLLVRHGM